VLVAKYIDHQPPYRQESIFGRAEGRDEVRDLGAAARQRIRQERSRSWAKALHTWLQAHRLKVPDGSAMPRPSTTA
jgi:transposase